VYSNELLSGLATAHPETRFQCCYRAHRFLRSWRSQLPPNCRRRLLTESWPSRGALFHGLNQRLPLKAKLRRAVCTFHDLFVLTGDYSTAEFRQRFAGQAREAARRSTLMIAVSEFTASQVESLLGVERSRIRIVPHGVRPVDNARPLLGREKMILHVGALQRRKNLTRLVEAMQSVDPDWRLVLAGCKRSRKVRASPGSRCWVTSMTARSENCTGAPEYSLSPRSTKVLEYLFWRRWPPGSPCSPLPVPRCPR